MLIAVLLTGVNAFAQSEEEVVAAPEECYLVGVYNNWQTPDVANINELYTLTDPDKDGVYYGKYYFDKDEFSFKIFLGIGDWDDEDLYLGTDIEITMKNITETFIAVSNSECGKMGITNQNFSCIDWIGGEVEIFYDFNNKTIRFGVGLNLIYLNLWNNTNNTIEVCSMQETTESGVYSCSVRVNRGNNNISFNFSKDKELSELYSPATNEKIFFTGDTYSSSFKVTENAGSATSTVWEIDSFEGGYLYFTIDLNRKTLVVEQYIIEDCVYLVGQFTGWATPDINNEEFYQNYRLMKNENGIYSGTFYIDAGEFIFRIYADLTGWDGGDSYGVGVEDIPVDFEFNNNEFFGSTVVEGKGAWNFLDWAGGYVRFEFDKEKMLLLMYKVTETGVEELRQENGDVEYYNLQGIGVVNPDNGVYIKRQGGKTTKVVL